MNRFILILLANLFALFVLFALHSYADDRLDWGGDWDVFGAVNGETLSATATISGATLILGASEISVSLSRNPTHGHGLIYNATNNEITLQEIVATSTPDLALDDLSDVSALNPPLDSLLQWNGSVWSVTNEIDLKRISGDVIGQATSTLYGDGSNLSNLPAGTLALDDLTDVTAQTKAHGQVLGYSAASGLWSATTVTSAPSLALDDLTDAVITAPSNNEILQYNGSNWINATNSGASLRASTIIVAASTSLDTASADYICDGTDDDVQINAALNEASTAPGGGRVLLMEGIYYCSAQIRIATNNLILEGQGPEATIIRRGFNYTISGTEGLIYVRKYTAVDVAYISILNLSLDGNKGAFTSANNNNIRYNEFDYCIMQNVIARNSSGAGIYTDDTGTPQETWSLFADSECSDNGGIGMTLAAGSDYTTIRSMRFLRNTSDGLFVAGGAENCLIINCYAQGNLVDGFEFAGDNNTASNCMAELNGNGATDIAYNISGNHSSYSNLVSDTQTGVGFEIASTHSTFTGLVAKSSTSHGFSITSSANHDTFSSCTAYLNGGTGWTGNTPDQITLQGCYSIGNTGYGINLTGADHVYNACRISGNGLYGIQFSTTNTGQGNSIISNNRIENNGTVTASNGGIYIMSVDNLLVSNNVITDTAGTGYGILIDDSGGNQAQNIVLTGNLITGVFTSDINHSGQTDKVIQFNQFRWKNGTYNATEIGEVIIGTATASAKIAFATDEVASIKNVITVSSAAPTNPIAVSWDMWSDPALKENISLLPVEEKAAVVESFSEAAIIEFDWKSPVVFPDPADEKYLEFPDLYSKDVEEASASVEAWKANPNRSRQRSLDLSTVPKRWRTYNEDDRAVGLNLSQVLNDLVVTVQEQQKQIDALKALKTP